jgi:hypothetical protein
MKCHFGVSQFGDQADRVTVLRHGVSDLTLKTLGYVVNLNTHNNLCSILVHISSFIIFSFIVGEHSPRELLSKAFS